MITVISTFPVEVNGVVHIFNPLKGIDTQDDLDVVRVGIGISEIAKELAKIPETNFFSIIALADKLRKGGK